MAAVSERLQGVLYTQGNGTFPRVEGHIRIEVELFMPSYHLALPPGITELPPDNVRHCIFNMLGVKPMNDFGLHDSAASILIFGTFQPDEDTSVAWFSAHLTNQKVSKFWKFLSSRGGESRDNSPFLHIGDAYWVNRSKQPRDAPFTRAEGDAGAVDEGEKLFAKSKNREPHKAQKKRKPEVTVNDDARADRRTSRNASQSSVVESSDESDSDHHRVRKRKKTNGGFNNPSDDVLGGGPRTAKHVAAGLHHSVKVKKAAVTANKRQKNRLVFPNGPSSGVAGRPSAGLTGGPRAGIAGGPSSGIDQAQRHLTSSMVSQPTGAPALATITGPVPTMPTGSAQPTISAVQRQQSPFDVDMDDASAFSPSDIEMDEGLNIDVEGDYFMGEAEPLPAVVEEQASSWVGGSTDLFHYQQIATFESGETFTVVPAHVLRTSNYAVMDEHIRAMHSPSQTPVTFAPPFAPYPSYALPFHQQNGLLPLAYYDAPAEPVYRMPRLQVNRHVHAPDVDLEHVSPTIDLLPVHVHEMAAMMPSLEDIWTAQLGLWGRILTVESLRENESVRVLANQLFVILHVLALRLVELWMRLVRWMVRVLNGD